jgi:hypothetical protein
MRIPVATQTALLHAYYSLDERFSRLLAGKRLTPKLRRTTQLVEQCGVTLRSFERQFDNLKRVFECVCAGAHSCSRDPCLTRAATQSRVRRGRREGARAAAELGHHGRGAPEL